MLSDLSKETEIKCLQKNYENFPPDVLQAMCEGQSHERLPRRGWLTQSYLPIDQQSLFDEVVDILNRNNIPFGTSEQQQHIAQLGKAKELRILEKPNYQIYLITIKLDASFGGYSLQQLETPEEYSAQVKDLLPQWKSKVIGKLKKFWFDIVDTIDGKECIIEQDILPELNHLIVNELEIEQENQTSEVNELLRLKKENLLPPYFEKDVTHLPEMKSRALAFSTFKTLPLEIQSWLSSRSSKDLSLTKRILQAHR